MKKLSQQFKEILDTPHISPSGRFGSEAVLEQLIQAVKERDRHVVGGDTVGDQLSNMLRQEQRKRAEETL